MREPGEQLAQPDAAAPVHALPQAGHWLLGVCALAVIASAIWAFLPPKPARIETPRLTIASADGDPHQVVPLDLSVFRAPLWVAPPPTPPPPAPPPPAPLAAPPPPRLQLVGILREGEGYSAVLYDPDADRLVIARGGQLVAGLSVQHVGASAVDLRDANGVHTLALRPEASSGGGP